MSRAEDPLNLLFCCLLAFGLSLATGSPLAQVATATISGTVTDATGAVLPGVEITITQVDTGQSRLAITGDEGRYNAPQLAVGNYQVRAELAGFQTSVRQGLGLLVGQEAVVDFAMEIGVFTIEVVVTGQVPQVNTTSGTLSDVITESQVHDLPLNSRNLSQLSLLTPGVTRLYTAPAGGVIQGPSSVRVTVGGARTYQTGYLLDGTDVTDASRGLSPGGAAGALFGVETVKEFQVITNNYSAEYSRFSGGIMSMVTKTGTNAFHGSLFFFHRNDNLDATNFFTHKFDLEKPEFRRHQFGATLGGPIVQDKTFFFFSYEGFRQDLGQSLVGLVPTAEAKQGLFAAVDVSGGGRNCSANHLRLGGSYDPNLDRCRLPLHPDIGPFLALYPDPNGAIQSNRVTGDLVANKPEPTLENFFTGRVDHTFSESDSLFGRFSIQDGDKKLAQNFSSFIESALTTVANTNIYTTLEWKHIFSPNTMNAARMGAQRNEWTEVSSNPGPLLIGFFPGRPMGSINLGNGVMLAGTVVTGQNISNQFSWADDLFLTRGRHDVKLGGLVTRYQTNDFTRPGDGRFDFSSVANYVTGTPNSWNGNIPGSVEIRGARQTVLGFYIQDDFKWTPHFTLNLGLRYEPATSPTEVNGRLANLRDPLVDTEAFIGEPYFKTPSRKNFAPRLGLAWDPVGDGKTSIRTGFGIFHETILPFHYSNQIRRSPPLTLRPIIRNRASLAAQFPAPPMEALQPVGLVPFPLAEFEPSQPYMAQWNLTLQREIVSDITLTAAYVGSKGTHLLINRNLNVAVPEILPDGRKLFRRGLPARNPAFSNIVSWEFSSDSHYHGLQLGGRKRFSQGLQFQVAYTFGRSIDSASRINFSDIQEVGGRNPQDAYDVHGSNQGLSVHDVRHSLSVNYVYELPIQGISGAARNFLEGWQINGILTLSTGSPRHLDMGSGSGLTDYDRDRFRAVSRPHLSPGASNNPVLNEGRDPDKYFDSSVFTLQDPGFYGNLGRNTLIGPGVSTFDFSLFKNTELAEEVRLQFRAEFFNLFNRANFGTPVVGIFSSATITPNSGPESVPCSIFGATGPDTGCNQLVGSTLNPNAGRITRSRTTARQIQLGLRLIF